MNVRADLRAYYEEEARLQTRGPLRGRRVELRDTFVRLLQAEGRTSVVDFGAGPGRDAPGFFDGGCAYLGLDLAVGNGLLAAERGCQVVPASIASPPLRTAAFDAGWCMSTLMHIPESEVTQVVTAMAATLKPAAPLLIGLWGGELGEHLDETQLPGQRRLFDLRTPQRNRELFAAVGDIEDEQVWPGHPEGWNYQVFVLRTHGPKAS